VTDIEQLLHHVVDRGASDLHLKAGRPPVLRVHGRLIEQAEWPALTAVTLHEALNALTTEEQRAALERDLELDWAYELPGVARFRVNAGYQLGDLYFTLRHIRTQVPTLVELGLPAICARLVLASRGLVLVTGPTGCGKSTTLAAMINHINVSLYRRIVTIEDPVEYLFIDRSSVITQREVGRDTRTFASALKHALRQDPDVIMVGEMRDLDTIAATLTAAETGHLVLATLHTPSAPEAIDRIVDVFPPHQQAQVRVQLAMTLNGVITQRLVLRADGAGRAAACEIMTGTPAIRNLIRENKTPQMMNVIQTGSEYGMQTMDQALRDLYRGQVITVEEAVAQASDAENFKRLLGV
jgi:twitching motility protein PilT